VKIVDVALGEIGQSADHYEAARIAALCDKPLPSDAKAVAPLTPRGTDVSKAAEIAARQAVIYVMRTEVTGIRQAIADMVHDIKSNTELVRTLDVPLEQVAASHERAAESFETLRHEIGSISQRLSGVEKVIDVAGLRKAQDGAEARFQKLCALLEETVRGLMVLEGGALEAVRQRVVKAEKRKPKKRKR
jgi:hypothetical protein